MVAGGQKVTVRLACIDAPELSQRPWGEKSRDRLQELLPRGFIAELKVATPAVGDRYGRQVGELFWGGRNINLQLVAEGLAVVYRQYLSSCPESRGYLVLAEAEAKTKGLGLWGEENPLMPWDFRRGMKQAAVVPVVPKNFNTCDPSYPDVCIPPPPPDLNCGDIPYRKIRVTGIDPHKLDGNRDGIACN
ncbi:MAG TPA: thermonuclease family protein [Nostocaceae cyanobacterium]|nr:thermonuclease family protein [Nostocaceae cyanobacterium]